MIARRAKARSGSNEPYGQEIGLFSFLFLGFCSNGSLSKFGEFNFKYFLPPSSRSETGLAGTSWPRSCNICFQTAEGICYLCRIDTVENHAGIIDQTLRGSVRAQGTPRRAMTNGRG